MPRLLLTADWHLTSRAVDAYRWELFPWLRKQVKALGVDALVMAGDLADLKDNHPAALVNRLVDEFTGLTALGCAVYAIPGNHDYTDPRNPYFRFLANLEGVHFYTEPTVVRLGKGAQTLFLPHTRRWRADWGLEPHKKHVLGGHDLIVLHQPIKGAATESGGTLEDGLAAKVFREERVGHAFVVAGDVHVPQRVGNVTYTGAPYPVHFGDVYAPRVLLWDGGRVKSVPRPCLSKAIVRGAGARALNEAKLTAGDMVKVRLELPRSEFVDWQKRKREVEERAASLGLVLCGVEVKEKPPSVVVPGSGRDLEARGIPVPHNANDRVSVFKQFCEQRGVDGAVVKAGVEVLEA